MTGAARSVEDIGWFRVDSPGTAGAVRRAATEAGEQLGLTPARVGELAIAVSEMGSNLHKHADDGWMLLRYLRTERVGGVGVLAVDSGPGMPDLAISSRDGHSTAGSLGIGLGAIARLASEYDAYSVPGRGSVLAAEFWPRPLPVRPVPADGLTRPIAGETMCGDAFSVREHPAALLLMLCDGLGHGPIAAAAAGAAREEFLTDDGAEPAVIVERLHRRMARTRGAAVGVAALHPAASAVRYAGLGNVAAHIASPGMRRSMVSMPGIAGHQRRTVREFEYPLPADGLVVLHSDGVTERWSLDDYPGLWRSSPIVVAATLLRDAGVRRDDASVLVAGAGT